MLRQLSRPTVEWCESVINSPGKIYTDLFTELEPQGMGHILSSSFVFPLTFDTLCSDLFFFSVPKPNPGSLVLYTM